MKGTMMGKKVNNLVGIVAPKDGGQAVWEKQTLEEAIREQIRGLEERAAEMREALAAMPANVRSLTRKQTQHLFHF